jgi:uncharacterized FlaG/YvyC family protein
MNWENDCDVMTTQRNRTGNRLNKRPESSIAGKLPTRKFPIQRAIQKLEKELHAFNERIAELEDESHSGRAMEVLKENALDFAQRIDELRSVLVEQAKKTKP